MGGVHVYACLHVCMYVLMYVWDLMYFKALLEKDRCSYTSKAFRGQRPLPSVIITDHDTLHEVFNLH